MIPRTFPSTFAANGQQQMVVYSLPSITGLTAWIDYIPVKGVTTESATLENTYANGGYQVVDSLASLTGKQAWLDYIPVYEDASYTKPWSTDAGGYIPTSALAALLLDFTSGRLDPRITFSRTTNATLTNSAGLVANAPMNLLTFSEQFDNAAWKNAANFSSVTANATTAPDGTITADKLVELAVTNFHATNQSAAAGTYTFSFYAKAGERSFVGMAGALSVNDYALFNLSNGTVSSNGSGVTSAAITSAGNGWYRCSGVLTINATGPYIYMSATGGTTYLPSYAGNGTSGVFLWGAQLELGSTATTYNSTTVKNLLGFTENFDNAAWTKSNASITSGFTDIYGQPFAQKLVENTANAGHQVTQLTVPSSGAVLTSTIYAKLGERRYFMLYANNPGSGQFFDLQTGTKLGTFGTAPTSSSITDVGNGWYRCSVTVTTTSTGTTGVNLYMSNDGTGISYTGDGTSGIYIFGAQLSDSASVDPYVYQPVAAPSSVAYYGPRFDYDPVTLAPKGLLIEEQRTNLLLQSETFDNASWVKVGATVTANTVASPDGTVDADKLVEDTSTGVHVTTQNVSMTSGVSYTFSVFAKAAERSRLFFERSNSTLTAFTALVDLTGGTVVSTTGTVTASITAVGNGWYRISLTVLAASTASGGIQIDLVSTGSTTNYTGNGTSGLFIWGAQLEAGAFATSYIPTVASQVTRAADSASMIGNNFARWYNVNVGTVYAEYSVNGLNPASSNAAYGISAGTTADFIVGRTLANQSTNFAVRVGGVDQASLSSVTVAAGSVAKSAGAYALNDFAFLANAGAVQTDTSGTLPVVTQMQIGGLTSASNPLNGTIKRIAYYPRRLANTELQGITS